MNKLLLLAIVIGIFVFIIMRQNGNKEAAQVNVKLGSDFLALL